MSAEELEAKLQTLHPLARPLGDALNGAVYPLERSQLIWVARENDAPPTVVTLLSALPARSYRSLAEVQEAAEPEGAREG